MQLKHAFIAASLTLALAACGDNAQQAADAAAKAKEAAAAYPENNTRPVDAQGGALGVGRMVMPGDKDYNRGSLSGKGR